jgi:hypothetical protein
LKLTRALEKLFLAPCTFTRRKNATAEMVDREKEMSPMTPEPFVSAETAAEFLSISRRHLLALARQGMAGAYALGMGTKRTIWVFRLSELSGAVASRTNLLTTGQKYATMPLRQSPR